MTVEDHNLKLIVMPGSSPPKEFITYYETAYVTWRNVWEEAAVELDDFPSRLYSNDFVRQDEILAIFKDDDCVSLGFWTELDMNLITSREDQYFQSWDNESLDKLRLYGNCIAKYSFLTVSKKYRTWGRSIDLSIKDLIIGVFGFRLLDSKCSAMAATTRNNKSMNIACIRNGAETLKTGLRQHGCDVDLVAWYPQKFKPYFEIEHLAKKLWINKLDYKQNRRIPNVPRKETTRNVRSFL